MTYNFETFNQYCIWFAELIKMGSLDTKCKVSNHFPYLDGFQRPYFHLNFSSWLLLLFETRDINLDTVQIAIYFNFQDEFYCMKNLKDDNYDFLLFSPSESLNKKSSLNFLAMTVKSAHTVRKSTIIIWFQARNSWS